MSSKQKHLDDQDSDESVAESTGSKSKLTPGGLNVLSRPKRSIHFKKLYIPPELMKPSADSVTSSSDEDFVPGAKKLKTKDDDDEESEQEEESSDDDEDEDDETDSDEEGSDDQSESDHVSNGKEAPEEPVSQTRLLLLGDNEDEDESDDEDFQVDESEMDDSEESGDESEDSSGADRKETAKPAVVKANGERRKVGRPRKPKAEPGETKPAKKPGRKNKKKKTKPATNKQFDEETEQFMSHFKTAIIKKPKKEPASSSKAPKMAQVPPEVQLVERVNTGPHVRCAQVSCTVDELSYSYPSYKINQNLKSSEQSSEAPGGLPRDKAPPIKDAEMPWECVFCSGQDDKLGGLYGPYRISLDYEADMNIENQMLDLFEENKQDKQDFIEVWMHANCAIWSPSVIVKNNSVYGVAAAVKAAKNVSCCSCQQTGANLRCKTDRCQSAYHYECALIENCSFDLKSFDIICARCLPNSDTEPVVKKPPKLVKAFSKTAVLD